MEYVVYKITNLKNGMVYVGSTNNFNRRIKEHKRLTFGKLKDKDFDSVNIKTGRKKVGLLRVHNGMYLDFRETDESHFMVEIIEVCDSKIKMLERENYWILKHYEKSYNTVWIDESGKSHSHVTKLSKHQWKKYRMLQIDQRKDETKNEIYP